MLDIFLVSYGALFSFLKLARETLSFWVKAFAEDTAKRLENFGFIQYRPGGIISYYRAYEMTCHRVSLKSSISFLVYIQKCSYTYIIIVACETFSIKLYGTHVLIRVYISFEL